MQNSANDIRILSETSTEELLAIARDRGSVLVRDGDDVFELRTVSDRISDRARDYLVSGGTVSSE